MTGILEGISEQYIRLYPDEAVRIIEQLDANESAELFTRLPAKDCARLLARVSLSLGLAWAKESAPERLIQVAAEMPNDLCALFIRRLPAQQRETILNGLPSNKKTGIAKTLDYPAQSIGAVIDPIILTVMEDMTMIEAINQVRDSVDYQHDHLYVVNRDQQLTGIVTLREFITTSPETTIKSCMQPPPLVLTASANRSQFVEHVIAAGYDEVPVTDNNKILIGVLRKSFVLKVDSLSEPEIEEQPVSLVLSLAELFWQITAGLLPGGSPKNND